MKVSNYKVAEHFLKAVAKTRNTGFVDVPMEFEEDGGPCGAEYRDARIVLSNVPSLAKALICVISTYLMNWSVITGSKVVLRDQEVNHLIGAGTAVVRSFVYASNSQPQTDGRAMITCLRQFPVVWLLLRDVIVPLHGAELKDIEVVRMGSPKFDAAVLIDREINPVAGDQALRIALNTQVESSAIQSAFLLAAALRGMKLDPASVVAGVVGDAETRKTVYGFVRMAFVVDDDVADFFLALSSAAGLEDPSGFLRSFDSEVWIKEAQSGGITGNIGWFDQNLLESTLDVARGPDYTVTKLLKPYVDELWRRVADEKKRRGKDDMAMEDLLRVQSKGMRPKPGELLQALLAEQRIW